MTVPTTFTVVNDETLVAAIQATHETLVYVAPGVTKPVVDALASGLASKPNLICTLILDLDPEVYRLGYGTQEGLLALQELAARQQIELRQQEGLRIGLLITDGQTLLYSPTPLLIEAGSTSASKPNAVIIPSRGDSTAALMHACAANGAKGDSSALPQQAEIGKVAAKPEQVAASVKALENLPPKKFDVARIERVFESKIQFVELEVTGYRLSAKKVAIPNDLLVGNDKELQVKLKNNFALLAGEQGIKVQIPVYGANLQAIYEGNEPRTMSWSEQDLEIQRKSLYEDFLIPVPKFGQVIMRSRRKDFDSRIDLLKKQIDAFREAIEEMLDERILDAIHDLAKTLMPRIRENIPSRYKKFLSEGEPSNDELIEMIENNLEKAIGGVAGLFNPELRCVFKDVTYESIRDSNFQQALTDAMRKAGGDSVVRQLFREFDAAPEVESATEEQPAFLPRQ